MTTERISVDTDQDAKNNGVSGTDWEDEVKRAALVPITMRLGLIWKVSVALLSLVVLSGIAAWIYQLKHGLGSAGYNDQAFWAAYIVDVVAFIGVSYGGAVISAILRLTGQSWRAPLTRLAEGTALVTVIIGALFVFPHLGHPEQFWEILVYVNTSSPLFWDFLAIGTYVVATVVFFYLPLIPDMAIANKSLGQGGRPHQFKLYKVLSLKWMGTKRQRSLIHGAIGVIALIIVPLAVSVHSALSWAFALTSRPGWMETIFPPYFVIAALYSGTALVIIVASAFRKGYHLERFITERHLQRLSYIMVALGLVYLYLTLADFLSEGYTGISTGWIYQTVVGRYSIPFWFYVIAGELVPMVLVALKKTRNIKGITIAAVGVVIALWVKRIVIVLPPATQPLIGGQWGTYHFTAVSILVTLAGVVAIPLGLMLLFRILPVLSIDEMIQADPVGSFERISQQSLEMVRLTAPGTHANGKHPDEQESEVSK
jgi:molybdopterin-containing oxidoreductase family membrane subunit